LAEVAIVRSPITKNPSIKSGAELLRICSLAREQSELALLSLGSQRTPV